MLVGALFLERGIFTHLFVLFICAWLLQGCDIVWGFCYACARLFQNEVYSHTFLSCLFVLDSSLACMVASRLWQFVTSPSGIVVVRANLATRLRSSRSVNFFRDRYTLAEVRFRYPFSRHDFQCDGRDSRWKFVTGRNFPANVTIRRYASPFLRPVTDRVYWTWVILY